MPFFTKKPVTIEARQYDGNAEALIDWIEGHGGLTRYSITPAGSQFFIYTLEGTHEVTPGDWIIKGVKGEFYPCKPDIFALTYDAQQA